MFFENYKLHYKIAAYHLDCNHDDFGNRNWCVGGVDEVVEHERAVDEDIKSLQAGKQAELPLMRAGAACPECPVSLKIKRKQDGSQG